MNTVAQPEVPAETPTLDPLMRLRILAFSPRGQTVPLLVADQATSTDAPAVEPVELDGTGRRPFYTELADASPAADVVARVRTVLRTRFGTTEPGGPARPWLVLVDPPTTDLLTAAITELSPALILVRLTNDGRCDPDSWGPQSLRNGLNVPEPPSVYVVADETPAAKKRLTTMLETLSRTALKHMVEFDVADAGTSLEPVLTESQQILRTHGAVRDLRRQATFEQADIDISYRSLLRQRVYGETVNNLTYMFNKAELDAFAREHGFPKAQLLCTVDDPGEVAWTELPPEVVVKPAFVSSSIGVHVVSREDGEFRLDGSAALLSVDDLVRFIREELARIAERFHVSKQLLVEEKLYDRSHPADVTDYKFYVFQKQVRAVCAMHHHSNGLRMAWYDRSCQRLPDSRVWGSATLRLPFEEPVPETWPLMLQAAESVAAVVPLPFVRVDLYDTTAGIRLGEITPTPGPFFYGDADMLAWQEQKRWAVWWGGGPDPV